MCVWGGVVAVAVVEAELGHGCARTHTPDGT